MTDPAALSANAIKYDASSAGFAGDDLNIAVAVAMAESGGNPRKHTTSPNLDAYGLWQINMSGPLGVRRLQQFKVENYVNVTSKDMLYDGGINAKAAFILWKTQGWKQWTAYRNGAYKAFIQQARDSTDTNNAGRTPQQESDYVGSINDSATPGLGIEAAIAAPLKAMGENLFKTASNLAGVLVAVTLLGLGVFILARKPIEKTAKIGAAIAAL